ncbi:MAG: hypothetical protein N3A38_08240 [Planctomycetota bacterium]|nr:hypothetical protein [Planctomycetota bacterium]
MRLVHVVMWSVAVLVPWGWDLAPGADIKGGAGIQADARGVPPIPAPPENAAQAAEDRPRHLSLALSLLPPSAKLAVAIDVSAIRNAKALAGLRSRFFSLPNVQSAASRLHEAFEFDIQKDLRMVAFACDPSRKGSEFFLIEGNFNQGRIREMLLAMAAAPDVVDGTSLYAIPDEKEPGKVNYGTFLKPDLIAFGNRDAVLAAAGKLREGDTSKMPCTAALTIRDLPAGAAVRVALDDIPSLPKIEEPFRTLIKSASGSLEVSDRFLLRLSVRCRDDMVARDIKEMAEGGAAMLRLGLLKKPALQKVFGEALVGARFEQAGTVAGGEIRIAADKVAAAAVELMNGEALRQMRGFAAEQTGAPEKGDF